MSGYIAFVKKEFTENIKNYRFLILFAVFLIFGITSAFLAKFTPEILSALAADMEMSSEPVALDAWKQFYKNISGVGFSAFIILYGSCLSGEYSKGTLVLMVTKGLSRKAVILAKYTVAAILMIGCVIFRQTFTGILFTGGIVAVISLLGIIEPIAKFSPFILTTKNIDLISGEITLSDFMIPAVVSIVISILGLLLAIRLFNKKQL